MVSYVITKLQFYHLEERRVDFRRHLELCRAGITITDQRVYAK